MNSSVNFSPSLPYISLISLPCAFNLLFFFLFSFLKKFFFLYNPSPHLHFMYWLNYLNFLLLYILFCLLVFVLFSHSDLLSNMEPQQQQNQQPNEDSSGSGKGSFLCRQSSTRWTPTTDQIRILKDLYYNNGVRSPSAEQIQRISARLRQYGKIEGKNVFYWFQNHKARERQKKRFTADVSMQRGASNGSWKPEDHCIHNKYPNMGPGAGVVTVEQMGNYGNGSVTVEKSFMNCSISASGSSNVGGCMNHNFEWVGMDPYASAYRLFDKRKSFNDTVEEEEEDQEEEEAAPEIETLPLFPMHGEDISAFCNLKSSTDGYYTNSWYQYNDGNGSSRTSLELSLNCYNGRSSDSF